LVIKKYPRRITLEEENNEKPLGYSESFLRFFEHAEFLIIKVRGNNREYKFGWVVSSVIFRREIMERKLI
jgi:hypothetical protein